MGAMNRAPTKDMKPIAIFRHAASEGGPGESADGDHAEKIIRIAEPVHHEFHLSRHGVRQLVCDVLSGGTPQEIITWLNSEIRNALATDDIKNFYQREALEPGASSPDVLSRMRKIEIAKYAKVIKAANIKVQ